MSKKSLQKPRGTRDILPELQAYFDYLEKIFLSITKSAGFSKTTTPVFEDTALFVRGVGSDTDIVEKEMYTFTDRSENSLTLRPEGTASIVRSYLENGMQSLPQPVKLSYFGPMYRYDRPQAGRYREFWQFGFEMIGDKSPIADAVVITTAFRIYEKVGLGSELRMQINSIGCKQCRPKFLKELTKYYQDSVSQLCPDCKNRLKTNPLRLLDCKQKGCQALAEEAPQIVNSLCDECHNHFKEVLEFLDEIGIIYEINPRLVRGLDYYTKTVFEFWSESDGSQNSLGGGGRYDYLVEQLGGKSTPALGFAGGVDRTVEKIMAINPDIDGIENIDIFVAQIGNEARKKCFRLMNNLWADGIEAEGCLDKGAISEQLKAANKVGAKYTLIMGQKEAYDETVIVKEMLSGAQEIIPIEKVIADIKNKLK
ncbi:MAG: histidine--tRNA ligase [bacterium]